MSKSGHSLALVIENLIQQDVDFEESLSKAMRLILPTTRRFRPVRTCLMSVSLQWHFKGFEECFYLNGNSGAPYLFQTKNVVSDAGVK